MGFKLGRSASLDVEETSNGEKTPVSNLSSGRTSPTLNLNFEDGIDSAEKSKETTLPELPTLESASLVTPAMKRKAWFQFTTLCLSIYVSGWNDGALGPMLPRLQAVYHVCALDVVAS